VLDFSAVRRKERTIQDLAEHLTRGDLATLTDEMCDRQLELIAGIVDADVTFVPDDPEANDRYAARPEDVHLSWTLGHVIVHATASSEEEAAQALTLARGLPVKGRSRYEIPWQTATTAEFVRHRIEESRRMRLAMLGAWPDAPHLDLFYTSPEGFPPVNAIGKFISGLSHDDAHLAQIEKIVAEGRSRIRRAPGAARRRLVDGSFEFDA
jgi:DinB superfamily